MKRPIVVITVGYIIGIVWGLYCNCSIAFLYLFILPIYNLFKHFSKTKNEFKLFSIKRYLRYIKIILNKKVIIVLAIASIISNTVTIVQSKKYNNLYTNITNVTLTGVVISNSKEKENVNVYKIKVEKLNGSYNFKNTYLLIDIPKQNNIKIDYGNSVEIKGQFIQPQVQRNYMGFDYKEYLKTQKIYGTVYTNKIKVINNNSLNPIFIFSNKVFQKIKYNVRKAFSDNISNLILGISLGYTEELDEQVQENFRDSNMAHVLAVSGMHITYIMSGLMILFRLVSIGKRNSKIIICMVLTFYMLITGFTPSVVRATVMGVLYLGRGILYRKTDVWTSLAISLLFILVYNPFLIESMSVILSYGGTLGIIIFNETLSNILDKFQIKDKKLKYKIDKKFKKITLFIKSAITIGISVQIFIIPIYIYNFNAINLTLVITYLAISTVIGPIVVIGFIAIVCSLISVKILKIIGIILIPLLKILVLISKLGPQLPLSKVYIGTPNLFEILIYYVFMIGINFIFNVYNSKKPTTFEYRIRNLISLIKYKFRQNKFKIISFISILFLIFQLFYIIPKDLKIYFIDVGQGDSTLIITPMNKSILIDGGGSLNSTYDVGKNTLLPYLLDRGITKLDCVMISHFDQDHVGGLLTIIEELKVGQVIISKQGDDSDNYKKFKEIVKEKKIKLVIVNKGDRLKIEKDLYFDILWPSKDNLISDNILNNNSIVCKMHCKDFSMLFTGDIEEIAEKQILQEYKNNLQILKSNILKVEHHGAKTSSIQEFLKAVSPKIALIGVGENNKFGHPNDNVLERLTKMRRKNL